MLPKSSRLRNSRRQRRQRETPHANDLIGSMRGNNRAERADFQIRGSDAQCEKR